MKKFLVCMFLTLFSLQISLAQQSIQGKVVSKDDGQAIAGAVIQALPGSFSVRTDAQGKFTINIPPATQQLQVSFIGFQTQIINVKGLTTDLSIALIPKQEQLQEVIVSTGYQDLPKERATGSFVKVDEELLNRRVSPNILSRLEDVVPGLTFNRGNSATGAEDISIRGRSTLFANAQPLIVIDNFPFDGALSSINPNDVASITILKDAAAASIWGARAGNGVIIITTKKGTANTKAQWSFNQNVTVGEKPDLFASPLMKTSDYIATEQALFAKGFYTSSETNLNKPALSPVVELLISNRDGNLSNADLQNQLNALSTGDVRNDYNKYLYQNLVNQQYALQVQGGSNNQRYYLSLGYDQQRANARGNQDQRLTVNLKNQLSFLNQKLSWEQAVYYVNGKQENNFTGLPLWSSGQALYPYASLVDGQGNPQSITKDYRLFYLQSLNGKGLLDWNYNPIAELNANDNQTRVNDLRWNTQLRYQIKPWLNIQALYQYNLVNNAQNNLQSINSYGVRDLVNQFTEVQTNGTYLYNLPVGGILDKNVFRQQGHQGRVQINAQKNWNNEHELNFLAAYEIKDLNTTNTLNRNYGYNDDYATSAKVDYVNSYKRFYNPASSTTIPYVDSQSDKIDRFISWLANAGYTYKKKYTFSLSGRIDRSNLFGVDVNLKAQPLWSAGLSWDLLEESFFPIKESFQNLRIRGSYGFSGNIDKTVSAYTTAFYNNGSNSFTRLPYAQISNPPNPNLKWETVKTWNLGLDFTTLNGKLTGTVETYRKNGEDLIGNSPLSVTTGNTQIRGNTANTVTSGVDLQLQASLLKSKNWRIESFLLNSWVKDKVTAYQIKAPIRSYLQAGDGINMGNLPLEGRPLYAVYSLRWGGLDPTNGDPISYLNGEPTKNYLGVLINLKESDLIYHGSARPTVFGAWRNSVGFKNWNISANISYRLGYYYRKNSIVYGNNMGLGRHGDFSNRWQQAGDELITQVPSVPSAVNTSRDFVYQFSEALVQKGDHIRLQDVQLSYNLKANPTKLLFNKIEVYAYSNNLSILWKASDAPYDPDYQNGAPPKTFALGLRLGF
jgi:TonB-linked SusC/RagA family outer membrane protein